MTAPLSYDYEDIAEWPATDKEADIEHNVGPWYCQGIYAVCA
jgi:hypothetical protein